MREPWLVVNGVVAEHPFHLEGGIFLFVGDSINDEGAAKTLGIDFFKVRF